LIYNKDATFPYPVLTNSLDNYDNGFFSLDVNLQANSDEYRFKVEYDLSSSYIEGLIKSNKAELIFVIQSKDNKFFSLNKSLEPICISKSRISLSKRTSIQLIVKAKEELCFKDNFDLIPFYDELKKDLVISKHSVLALSNIVIFDGSNKKPFELFEKKLDPNLKSDISIELGDESIIINYKSADFQFAEFSEAKALNYPYIYMGLQKALYKLIVEHSDDGESLDIDSMEIPENGLNYKLYNLLSSKFIDEVNINNMDEIICKVTDRIIEKYVHSIKGLTGNGN